VFDLGTFMRNSGSVVREFKVTNTGPKDIELGTFIYLYSAYALRMEDI
jgi:hypothetical protein